jgi:MFS family permease
MLRSIIAITIALYAIGFACAALAAVRWPSLLMMAALFDNGSGVATALNEKMNWRELGLSFGLAYLVAAFFFYSCATCVARRKAGSIIFYILGVGLGFVPLMVFNFEADWWQSPDTFQQTVLFSGVMTLFLFGALLELDRARKAARKDAARQGKQLRMTTEQGNVSPAMTIGAAPVSAPVLDSVPAPVSAPAMKRARRKPVPAAIARQRESFAAHGRRARSRNMR